MARVRAVGVGARMRRRVGGDVRGRLWRPGPARMARRGNAEVHPGQRKPDRTCSSEPEGARMTVLILILVAVVVVGLVAFFVVGFNRLRTQSVAADEALGGIDVQLTRRADLIPNLVSTVQGYATHERAT